MENALVGNLVLKSKHRLLCGDCTSEPDVDRLMSGEKAHLAAVDPPYNVGFIYDGSTVDDQKTNEFYKAFTQQWFGLCQSISYRQIVTPGCNNLAKWLRWFDAKHWGAWIKTNSMTNGVVSRFWCWEPVLFFGESWPRTRSSDVFDFCIGNQADVGDHPCPKPLKMWADLIENYSEIGQIIYDPFVGSGTTLIAAEQLGRRCFAMEICEKYVDVAIARWEALTGRKAILDSGQN